MHENCNIMRDLMPLCIDGAASDDSHRAVSRHIADCDECLKYYREMQIDMSRALTAKPSEDEVKQAMKLVSRKRTARALKIIGIALVALSLLWALLYWLTNDPIYVDNKDYAVDLYTTDTGFFMEYRSLSGRSQSFVMDFDTSTRTLHIVGMTWRLPISGGALAHTIQGNYMYWYDDETGFMWGEGRNSYAVKEIVVGRGDQPQTVLWQNGDPKPPAKPNSQSNGGMTPFAMPTPMATVLPALTAAPEAFATLLPRPTPSTRPTDTPAQ